jgi:hypothetical protein
MNPYEILHSHWPNPYDIKELFNKIEPVVIFSGDNGIHVKGVFEEIKEIAKCFDDNEFWLLSLDDQKEELYVKFTQNSQEEDYFRIIYKEAPTFKDIPYTTFPYAANYQCFIGSGDWLILSLRNEERFYILIKEKINDNIIKLSLKFILFNEQ